MTRTWFSRPRDTRLGAVRDLLPPRLRSRLGRRTEVPAAPRAPGGRRVPRPAGQTHPDPLIEALRTGGSLTDGLLSEIRSLLRADRTDEAGSIAAALKSDAQLNGVACLASALVAAHRGCPELAWHEFRNTPAELWERYAAADYVRVGVRLDRDRTLAEVRRLVRSRPPYVSTRGWLRIYGGVYGVEDHDLATEIYSLLHELIGEVARPSKVSVQRDWLERWIDRPGGSPTVPRAPGSDISFAVMDYGHPGRSRASANIGDHVQTTASLGHLVRHQDVTYSGRQDLVDLLTHLRGRVRADRQRRGVAANVNVLTVNRDASTYDEVPERTWMIAFGWFMHAIFGTRYAFPLHENLLPIFVSFHCNKRELLTSDAIEYLRAHAPIGCRDHTTVDILLSVDVPAFFSGCVTTTVDTVFPELPDRPGADQPIAFVDVPEERLPEGASSYKHSSDAVRFNSFTTNMYNAVELLENYRRRHPAAVTSRLHAYLPLRSLGVPVDFEPPNRADVRFPGLIDISDAEFDRIRDGILEKLERVMTMILQGAEPATVYAEWARINEPDVARARERLGRPGALPPATADIDHQVERARLATRTRERTRSSTSGAEVHVAVRFRASRTRQLNVLLESVVARSSRPVHVWLLDEGRRPAPLDRLGAAFPDVTFSAVPAGGIGVDQQDVTGRAIDGIAVLLLPRLLPQVQRVVLLPLDSVAEDDIATLFDLELDGCAVAVPRDKRVGRSSGFGVIHAAANRLEFRTTAAAELRRRAHGRHAFDFDSFSIDVAVFDLGRVRGDGSWDDAIGLAEEFGLDASEALHFLVGPGYAEVPDRWHHVPTRQVPAPACLVHWADAVKPWDTGFVAEQDRWAGWEAAFRTRTGSPAAT
jgi:hypothetical protein